MFGSNGGSMSNSQGTFWKFTIKQLMPDGGAMKDVSAPLAFAHCAPIGKGA